MASPSFDIPARPERRFPHSGGVEYTGETVFTLTPTAERSDAELTSLVESVLSAEQYTYGDWFDLPMPLYLVHDDDTGDVYRVAVRDGAIELHVLPATESAGLRAFYERVIEAESCEFSVDCRTA